MLERLLKFKFIEGNRTLVSAIAIGVLTFLLNAGYISQEQYLSLMGILTSLGLVAAAAHKTQ